MKMDRKEQLMRAYFEPYLKHKGATAEEIDRYMLTLTPPQAWTKDHVQSKLHDPALVLRRQRALRQLKDYLMDKYPNSKEGRKKMATYKLPESFPFPYFSDDQPAAVENRFTTIRGGVQHTTKLPPSLFF